MDLRVYGVRNVIELAPVLLAMHRMTGRKAWFTMAAVRSCRCRPHDEPCHPAFNSAVVSNVLTQPTGLICPFKSCQAHQYSKGSEPGATPTPGRE